MSIDARKQESVLPAGDARALRIIAKSLYRAGLGRSRRVSRSPAPATAKEPAPPRALFVFTLDSWPIRALDSWPIRAPSLLVERRRAPSWGTIALR